MPLPLERRFDLGPRIQILRNFSPPAVRVADDLRRCVVFLGHGGSEDFKSCGTAFFMAHEGQRFLITANHIAHKLGSDPFSIRLNSHVGDNHTIFVDPEDEGAALHPWLTHDDPTVDIAAMHFNFDFKAVGVDALTLSGSFVVTNEVSAVENIGAGNQCYAVGLFQLLQGKKRNLPVIHTGNIALMPSHGDMVPVEDWRDPRQTVEVEAYLVEMTNLEGLSGAPVFVRPEIELGDLPMNDGEKRDVQLGQTRTYLLGVWQASWTAPLDRSAMRYPLGMGIVVPAEKIIEILKTPRAEEAVERFHAHRGVKRARLDAADED